ncbi:nucleotidyltransferase family protein [Thalassotalea maritima]|uniref:nucleotidyltransferase domain-containing protein n=1 Tax=Thalassotalea maritima TaxID=3242416 RepID=UPI003526CF9E
MSKLIACLTSPEIAELYQPSDWQELMREARVTGLLGRLHYVFESNHIELPNYVQWHFASAAKIAKKQQQQLRLEVIELTSLLSPHFSVCFLKGASYYLSNLDCSQGRIASDIDILVPYKSILNIEFTLKTRGWMPTKDDEYDDYYYRQWMHEIAPLIHHERHTILDVHHNILPLTNRQCPDASKFDYQTVSLPYGDIKVLSKLDTIIHSASHLFSESEFHTGLRNLSDIDMMLRQFVSEDADFVASLIARAKSLGLQHYLHLALRYCHMIFNTPVLTEQHYAQQSRQMMPAKLWIYDQCFMRIFKPKSLYQPTWQDVLATTILYWRGHILRMPLRLLLPHLLRKAANQLIEKITDNSLFKKNQQTIG